MATAMKLAMGLMSGTSLDGVDAALIRTDGYVAEPTGHALTLPYDDAFRAQLRALLAGDYAKLVETEHRLTLKHAEAVQALLEKAGVQASDVEAIGFHGQTIFHKPDEGLTWQIGNPSLLAEDTGITVVGDFRRRDVAAGGQGAPLVPVYHAAIAASYPRPLCVLNIGGVANVTYVGKGSLRDESFDKELMAFDTGPGNALLDDWMLEHTGKAVDLNGVACLRGRVNEDVVAQLIADPYFRKHAPKSLDRNHFARLAKPLVKGLSLEDGAATLAAFTVDAVAAGAKLLPRMADRWLVAGGGRHNPFMMQRLAAKLGRVEAVEAIGHDGDAMEACAFAFLAKRSLMGLSLSYPTTTGVRFSVTGGGAYRA